LPNTFARQQPKAMKLPAQPSPISPSTSVALDALGLLAAAVVVFHASSHWVPGYPALHAALGRASHAAVVSFVAGLLGIVFERRRKGWLRLFEWLRALIGPRRVPDGK
jgi:hypothetical protein